jgi:hypothetical protein
MRFLPWFKYPSKKSLIDRIRVLEGRIAELQEEKASLIEVIERERKFGPPTHSWPFKPNNIKNYE